MRDSMNIPAFLVLPCLLAFSHALVADDSDVLASLAEMKKLLKEQQQEMTAQKEELSALRKQVSQQQALITELQAAQTPAVPGNSALVGVGQPEPVQHSGPESPNSEPPEGKAAVTSATGETGSIGSDFQTGSASSLLHDPASTLYNPSFPGAWHLPGTSSAMRIGGFVNVSAVASFDPLVSGDRFIVGSIPPEGQDAPGANAGTEVTANQSRINFEIREETKLGEMRAFLEADFEGSGDAFRLRHAYGQMGLILAGKTWSTLMDIDSRPEEVDFEGINGQILLRQSQLRFSPRIGENLSLKLSLEDPQTAVINGQDDSGYPDFVVSVNRMPFDFLQHLNFLGNWNSRIGVIFRDLGAQQTITQPDGTVEQGDTKTTFGWGITISGRTPLTWWGSDDVLLGQLTYGEGVGRYLNDLGSVGNGDAVFDPSGNLQALPVFAGYLSYQHRWPMSRWPGILRSNLTLSWVDIDNYNYQDDSDYSSTLRGSINLMYYPVSHARLGMEFLWGERKNMDDSKGEAKQFQISARYSF